MHSDQYYIDYLKHHDPAGIDVIYKTFASKVKRMILCNSGNEDDAADIFQESLIDIYKLSLKPDFTLTCSFEAFLIIICKRKWLSSLKSSYKKKVTNMDDDIYTNSLKDESVDEYCLIIEKEKTILSLLEQFNEKCREIIKACLVEKRQEQVAEKLGYSYAYLRKKKSTCMAEFSELVKKHQLFKN